MRLVVFACLAVALTAPAPAQNADFAAMMRDVNARVAVPDMKAIRADALLTLQAIARKDSACVPSDVEIEKPTPATAVTIAVQGILSGKLKNLWMAYGRPIGCPKAEKTRFAILLLANDEIRVREVNKGEAIASMSLMRDSSGLAALVAFTEIRKVEPACNGSGMQMFGTRVISQGHDLSPDFYGARFKGSWVEGWTFGVCGRRAEVPVEFTADGQGGAQFHIKSGEMRLLD